MYTCTRARAHIHDVYNGHQKVQGKTEIKSTMDVAIFFMNRFDQNNKLHKICDSLLVCVHVFVYTCKYVY